MVQPSRSHTSNPIRRIPTLVLIVSALAGSLWVAKGLAQSERAITITANSQEANSITGVITAEGSVTIRYPAQEVVATAQKAVYFTQEQRIELQGQVEITQQQNRLQAEQVVYLVDEGTIQAIPTEGQQVESVYILPAPSEPAPEPSPSP